MITVNSIRVKLTFWLLGGLALLWVAAGAGIYFSVRNSLIRSLDAELAVDARIARFTAKGDPSPSEARGGARRIQDRMPAYNDEEGNAFFQTWDPAGDSIERSVSLGESALPFPAADLDADPYFQTARLDDGREIRAMAFKVAPGGKGKGKSRRAEPVTMVIAKETASVQETLRSVIIGISSIGIAVAAAAALLIGIGVRRGLKPLDQLTRQTDAINAESLNARFDDEGAPIELQPIYHHLNELIDRLESSFDRERRFSSDVAHEMRTPVAELKMLNEVALKWEDQAGEVTHQKSLDIANRLAATIETILALARCESGELPVNPVLTPLESFTRECWEPFAALADKRTVSIEFNFDEESHLEADPDLLRHIVSNLLSNAASYCPEGGTIWVSGREKFLSVSNPAPDLEESQLNSLFDPYWRKDLSRTDTSHAGLGLTLSRACAHASSLRLDPSLQDGILTLSLSRRD